MTTDAGMRIDGIDEYDEPKTVTRINVDRSGLTPMVCITVTNVYPGRTIASAKVLLDASSALTFAGAVTRAAQDAGT